MVCATPRHEPLLQRRRTPRVALDVAVKVFINEEEFKSEVRSKDISRSGIALESVQPLPETIEPGDHIKLIVQTSVGDISATARVIRVERNWLVNKTTIGLEYTELAAASVEKLDKLLLLLGGKPRHPEGEEASPLQPGKTGLATWISAASETRGKFVGGAGHPEQTDQTEDHGDTEDTQQELNSQEDG
jgi:hypothetical protein